MADIAEMIYNYNPTGFYLKNRAIDLQADAQNLENTRANRIMSIEDQILGGDLSAWDKMKVVNPERVRQKYLSDEQQLKIGSQWASAFKNVAPENKARAYAQFLKAAPGMGIDVSDLPQNYDPQVTDAFVEQLANAGISERDRYTKEMEMQKQAEILAAQERMFNMKMAAAEREKQLDRQMAMEKADAALERENAQIQQAVDSGLISQEEADLYRRSKYVVKTEKENKRARSDYELNIDILTHPEEYPPEVVEIARERTRENPYGKDTTGYALSIVSNPDNNSPEMVEWAKNMLADKTARELSRLKQAFDNDEITQEEYQMGVKNATLGGLAKDMMSREYSVADKQQDRQWKLEDAERERLQKVQDAELLRQQKREDDFIKRQQALADRQAKLDFEREKLKANFDNQRSLQELKNSSTSDNKNYFNNTDAGMALRILQEPEKYNQYARNWAVLQSKKLSPEFAFESQYNQAMGKGAGERASTWESKKEQGYYKEGNQTYIKPNSDAEMEYLNANRKVLRNNEVSARAAQTVLDDITAMKRIAKEHPNQVSSWGSKLSVIPGTPAFDFAARVDSIRGNAAVDQLLNIKQSGAGLGQVPQQQLNMLADMTGNLARAQSLPELMDVINRFERIYTGVRDKATAENNKIYSKIKQPKSNKVVNAEDFFK